MATDSVSDRVRELAQHLGIDESEVIQQAVETGVDTLYRDMIISRYLDGALTREEAVDELGAIHGWAVKRGRFVLPDSGRRSTAAPILLCASTTYIQQRERCRPAVAATAPTCP